MNESAFLNFVVVKLPYVRTGVRLGIIRSDLNTIFLRLGG